MHASARFRRMLVGLVGLAAVVSVLLPGGYLGRVGATLESGIARPVNAAPMDCSTDMPGMQMTLSTDCAPPR